MIASGRDGERFHYQKIAQGNFRGEGTVLLLDHGDSFTTLHLSKLTDL